MAGSSGGNLGLMALNDTKAGMEGLDKESISKVIEEASKGSKFYAKKQEDQARISQQAKEMKLALDAFTPSELEAARVSADVLIDNLRAGRILNKVIVHVDMDMFYAAVEMRDQPDLVDKPMAVGGMGMLSTSNYKARRFGVRAAMPGFIAKKLCPHLVIVPTNMAKYAAVAEQVREVFKEYDPDFCPMSLDEAYLDITKLVEAAEGDDIEAVATSIVNEMRSKIKEKTGLTASAGIAPNCRLAKVASDMNKPNGQFLVAAKEETILDFVQQLSIRKIGGVGNVSEQLLNAIGVFTCKDIFEKRAEIKLLFSEISFEFYMEVSQGLGATSIEPPDERERKSMSTETTFQDTADRKVLLNTCKELCKDLAQDLVNKDILGSAVTVKIKSHDFKLKTKVAQLMDFTNDESVIFKSAERTLLHLLDTAPEKPLKLRLMGVRMSELKDKAEVKGAKQTSLHLFMAPKTNDSEAGRKFTCPICDKKFTTIKVLNDHIDLCISSGETDEQNCVNRPLSDVEEVSNTNVLFPALANDHDGEEDRGLGEFEIEGKGQDNNFHPSHSKDTKAGAQSPTSSTKLLTPPQATIFVCPVCAASLSLSTEEAMSRHVEDCLSRQEVAAIVKEEGAAKKVPNQSMGGGKRKLADIGTVIPKKRPNVDKIARIDSFFAKC